MIYFGRVINVIRSFINIFLPDDEYKRLRILYFMAEAAGLTILILFLLGIFVYFFDSFSVDGQVLLFLSPYLMMMYVFLRYIFSGMEYPELFHEKDYKKKRNRALIRSLIVGTTFGIILLMFKGIPGHISEVPDAVIKPILFIVFYYIIEIISLKCSIKKNIDLDH